MPIHLRTINEENINLTSNPFDFNPKLQLQPEDLNMIRITSISQTIKNSISCIENATSHFEATKGIAGLKSVTFLANHQKEYHGNDIIKAIKKFIITAPATKPDEFLFLMVIELLNNFIEIGYETILIWTLNQVCDPNSIFIKLLHDKNCPSIEIYQKNISFLRSVIRMCARTENPDIMNILYNQSEITIKRDHHTDIVTIMFKIIAEEFKESDKDRLQSLISLLQCITTYLKINSDNALVNKVIKSLAFYLSVLRSLTQSGSYITKSCLISMGNLMFSIKGIEINSNLIRLLQALCGHTDSLVRSCAWNVLAIIADDNMKGAQMIVEGEN